MFLYDLGIYLFGFAIRLASLWDRKARLFIQGRRGIFGRLRKELSGSEGRIVWVHCASLGEFEQGRPVMEKIKEEYPGYKILLTFFSPSGYEIRKDYPGADHIFYLPLDTPRNARKFVGIVRPEVAIFVKYEFWLNYLRQLRESGCRTFIISAIFRKDSIFFRPYGFTFRKALKGYETIFVQNRQSSDLLAGIGIDNVVVAGDTRFDRVLEISAGEREDAVIENFTAGKKVLIAGSTWPEDESLLAELIEAKNLRAIIVPHETDDNHISRIMGLFGKNAVRYTDCGPGTDYGDYDVLVVDTIGLLSYIYRYSEFSYIGGGFGVGIHNTLEAAVYGMPVAFGPNYTKFQEASDLITEGAARSVPDLAGLERWYELTRDPEHSSVISNKAREYVMSRAGATETIIGKIFRM